METINKFLIFLLFYKKSYSACWWWHCIEHPVVEKLSLWNW